jgi:hypothetical protein
MSSLLLMELFSVNVRPHPVAECGIYPATLLNTKVPFMPLAYTAIDPDL